MIAAGNTDSTAVAGEASTTLACPAGAASWAPSAAASLTYGAGTGSNCTSACGDSGGAGPAANATNCTLACGSSLGGYSSPLFFEPFSRGGACFGPANASASFVLVTTGATSNCTLTLLNGTNVTLGNVTSCAQATPRCPNGEVPANTAANFVSVVAYGPTVRSTARYVRSNVSSLTGAVGILTNLVLIATYSSGLLASLDWQDLGCGECAGQGSAQCMYVGSDVGGNARHGCAQQAAACYGYNATTAVPTDHGVNVTVTAGENPCAAGLVGGVGWGR